MTKERVIEAVKDMPPTFDLDALFEKLLFIEKVEEGLNADDNNETYTSEEVLKLIEGWQK